LREFDYFIERGSVEPQVTDYYGTLFEGRLLFLYGVYLDVRIKLGFGDRHQIDVWRYTFHAGITGADDRTIFQYDNAHAYTQEGHPDPHHKHRFDPVTGKEITPPEWIGEANRPSLRSVLAELERWCLENRQSLER
jgi:hypothetical protein